MTKVDKTELAIKYMHMIGNVAVLAKFQDDAELQKEHEGARGAIIANGLAAVLPYLIELVDSAARAALEAPKDSAYKNAYDEAVETALEQALKVAEVGAFFAQTMIENSSEAGKQAMAEFEFAEELARIIEEAEQGEPAEEAGK